MKGDSFITGNRHECKVQPIVPVKSQGSRERRGHDDIRLAR